MALREIRKYQKSTELLIKKLPFARLVRPTSGIHLLSTCPRGLVHPSSAPRAIPGM